MRRPGEIENVKKIHDTLAWDKKLRLGLWQWRERGWRQLQEI